MSVIVDPDPFVRGLVPGLSLADRGRLPATAAAKLPVDTVGAGRSAAGVHLAFTGDATALRVSLLTGAETSAPDPALTPELVAWIGQDVVGRAAVEPVGGAPVVVELALPERAVDAVVRVYLPEAFEVEIASIEPVGGGIAPAPTRPRWVIYGDSISQGWSVSTAGNAWPSLVAERLGLDLVNLGFAGSARGELPAAIVVAESQPEAVALAWGTNAWSSIPTDADAITQTLRLFLTTIVDALPAVPVLVISPIVRPAAEATLNRFGATLPDLRGAIEAEARRFAAEHPGSRIEVLPGLELVPADQLVDGIHPGDEGNRSFAAAVTPVLGGLLNFA